MKSSFGQGKVIWGMNSMLVVNWVGILIALGIKDQLRKNNL
jgi:hypothetical protein